MSTNTEKTSTEETKNEIQKKIEALEKEKQELEEAERERVREEKRKADKIKWEQEAKERKVKFIEKTTPLMKRIAELINRIDETAKAKVELKNNERNDNYWWAFTVFGRDARIQFSTWSQNSRFRYNSEPEQMQLEAGSYHNAIRRREGKRGFNDKKLSDLAAHMLRQVKGEIEKEKAEKEKRAADTKFAPKFWGLFNKYKDELDIHEWNSTYHLVTMTGKNSKNETVRIELNGISLELAEKILALLPKKEKK